MNSRTARIVSQTSAVRMMVATALLALAATAAGAQAAPQSATDIPAITVKYSDLNLATPEGNRVLYRRIVAAAAKVCPPTEITGTRLSRNRGCVDQAVARAVSATKNAQLAEIQATEGRSTRS